MAVRDDGVIVDDKERDWGTRYVPDRNRSPVEHLGGMPVVIENLQPEKAQKKLPDYDASKLVVPPSNVPAEKALQALIDKVFSEKEKEALFTEAELGLGADPVPHPTEAEARKADQLDEKNQKKLEQDALKNA